MRNDPFLTLDSKTVFSNPWIRLEQHQLEVRSNGRRFTYTYLESPPSVMVVAITPEGKIPIVREYRYPSRSYCYELPGGGSRGFKSIEAAARNELAQETGWKAAAVEELGSFIVYSGLSDESCHVFLARDLEPGSQRLDETEVIESLEVTPGELRAMIRGGEFRDGMSLAALGIAEPHWAQGSVA